MYDLSKSIDLHHSSDEHAVKGKVAGLLTRGSNLLISGSSEAAGNSKLISKYQDLPVPGVQSITRITDDAAYFPEGSLTVGVG